MLFNVTGAGGGGIKLKIQNAAKVEELPAEGSAGDFYIITEETLTGTRYVQPTEATGTFEKGDVWIRTKESSATQLNLAKKGSLIVGLHSVHVWDGEKWVETDYRVWAENGWTKEGGYLITAGVPNVEFTITGATLTENEGYLFIDATSGASGYYRTTEAIDLTEYSTLNIKASSSGAFGRVLAVWGLDSTENEDTVAETSIGTDVAVWTLDVSTLMGQHTVGVLGKHATDTGAIFDISLYDMWLE